MKIIVVHSGYGCESGCCGHYVEVDGNMKDFHFTHPRGETREQFVRRIVTKQFGQDHVKDIDWENCIVVDD
jgi:hypothetical protein